MIKSDDRNDESARASVTQNRNRERLAMTALMGALPDRSTTPVVICCAEDAVPFARAVASMLRSSAGTAKGRALLTSLPAIVGIRSSVDFHSATVFSDSDCITVVSGVSADAAMVLDMDPRKSGPDVRDDATLSDRDLRLFFEPI